MPLLPCLLTACPPDRLLAFQPPLTLSGRLVLVGSADSTPVRAAMVVAHRIGTATQGPLDSARTDAAGRFRFRVAQPESGAVYVVSARHAGIGYFSDAFGGERRDGAGAITLAVFDTASSGTPLTVGTRHVVLTRAADDGSRRVLDLISVRNGGIRTRIAADSTRPTWRMRLPAGVAGFELGDSEVPASAVRLTDSTVEVGAPFPPGDKQVVLTYVLPAGSARLVIPIDQPTALFDVLAEDSASAPGGGLVRADPMPLEGRLFQRFSGSDLEPGARPAVELAPDGGRSRELWWIPVLLAGGLLVGGGIYATRVARAS